jgi:hypothetical protein
MLQYALNDARSVVYLYFIFYGMFIFLKSSNGNDNNNGNGIIPNLSSQEKFKTFYENLKDKFAENRENAKKLPKNLNMNEINLILVEIGLRCAELVKIKLKEKYIKVNIAFDKK